MAVDYEPFSPKWRDDPYPTYRALRDRDPVHFAGEADLWCVSRYQDVHFVLNHPETFSSRAMYTVLMNAGKGDPPPLSWKLVRFVLLFLLRARMNPLALPKARILISADAPVHGPLRNLVNRGFTPKRIAEWEGRIREVVSQQMAKRSAGEMFDVVRDLAVPLPVRIIAEMLGVPADRSADFKRWSDAIVHGISGPGREDPFAPDMVEPFIELSVFVKRIIGERRRHPGDDVVSAIIAEEPGGEALSTLEVLELVLLLLVAGNETTTNLIGNAVNALLDHPEQLARVSGDASAVPGAIEETLRWNAPVQMVFRITRHPVELAGTRIPEGATVALLLGSANRDERRFEDPDVFDVGRDTSGHLGFGFGQHFCLGAALARLEGRVALEALVPELGGFERVGRTELLDSFLVRGPRRIELRPGDSRSHALLAD